jgi:general secretion pathway protein G
VYQPFDPNAHGVPSGARRDRFLVPLNSTFDLYSTGPDGSTVPPLSGPGSDDIIRANDGGYIGLASKF